MSDRVREALELLLHDIRFVATDEPPERMIPTQHRAGDIRQARAALAAATPGEPRVCQACHGKYGVPGNGNWVRLCDYCHAAAMYIPSEEPRPTPTPETVERVALCEMLSLFVDPTNINDLSDDTRINLTAGGPTLGQLKRWRAALRAVGEGA